LEVSQLVTSEERYGCSPNRGLAPTLCELDRHDFSHHFDSNLVWVIGMDIIEMDAIDVAHGSGQIVERVLIDASRQAIFAQFSCFSYKILLIHIFL